MAAANVLELINGVGLLVAAAGLARLLRRTGRF